MDHQKSSKRELHVKLARVWPFFLLAVVACGPREVVRSEGAAESEAESKETQASYIGDRLVCARLAEATAGERTPEKDQLIRDTAQEGIDKTKDIEFRELLRSYLNAVFADDLGAQMTVAGTLQSKCEEKL